MEISILDKSNYLRGLLIVAKKDNQLAEQEKKIIRHCAEKLGFARDFYEDTLKDLLANTYISEEPIIFSDKNIAESFITEGLNLAHSDNSIVGAEIDYLKSVAIINNLGEKWFEEKMKNLRNSKFHFTLNQYIS
jgi:hypothetical protein